MWLNVQLVPQLAAAPARTAAVVSPLRAGQASARDVPLVAAAPSRPAEPNALPTPVIEPLPPPLLIPFGSNDTQVPDGALDGAHERAVIAAVRRDPAVQVLVEGHADRRGSEARNQALSAARARAVATWLTERGAPQERLVVRGYGSRRPLATGDDDEALARNRRVEVYVRRGEP